MARGEQPQVPLDHGELDGRLEVERQLVVPRRHGAALLQPPDALLHHGSAAVRLAVEPDPPIAGLLVLAPRDDRLDAVPRQPAADARVAVALVPGQPHRTAPRPITRSN